MVSYTLTFRGRGARTTLLKLPVSNIGEVAGNRCRCCHHRTHQMRPSTTALAPFEIPIACGSTAFTRLQNVRVHSEAHGASRFPPFESSFPEDSVQPFLLRLALYRLRTRHDHGPHLRIHPISTSHARRRPQIFQARVGARSDEHAIHSDLL